MNNKDIELKDTKERLKQLEYIWNKKKGQIN